MWPEWTAQPLTGSQPVISGFSFGYASNRWPLCGYTVSRYVPARTQALSPEAMVLAALVKVFHGAALLPGLASLPLTASTQ